MDYGSKTVEVLCEQRVEGIDDQEVHAGDELKYGRSDGGGALLYGGIGQKRIGGGKGRLSGLVGQADTDADGTDVQLPQASFRSPG